jgi:hypothetical protein
MQLKQWLTEANLTNPHKAAKLELALTQNQLNKIKIELENTKKTMEELKVNVSFDFIQIIRRIQLRKLKSFRMRTRGSRTN